MELSNDLLFNRDKNYSVKEFPLNHKVDGKVIDMTSNCQICNTYFDQVPLIKRLVDAFVKLFPYLSIDMVWLIHKSKPAGDRFQGWHKDLALSQRITKK
jgi:hypothetical protein